MMKKLFSSIILTSLFLVSGLSYAGQHSGLGGTPPPTTPAPDPSVFETLEQYYQQYYQWLREQTEAGQQQPSVAQDRK